MNVVNAVNVISPSGKVTKKELYNSATGKIKSELIPGGSGSVPTWGEIVGTLANQSDLNAALAAKASSSDVYSKTDSDDRNLGTGGTYASVDLELPSGTKWARANVGATAETDYGDLFAWGATEPYRQGTDSTDNYSVSKANTIQHDLYPNQDAATVHMGTGWQMPTKAQYDELLANTYGVWGSVGGVNGRIFYKTQQDSHKGQHDVAEITALYSTSTDTYIFFPASGYYDGSSLYLRGSRGYFWARTFYSSTRAWILYFGSSDQGAGTYYRYYGFSVRGVRV